ncbi:MAG: porin [Acidobacteriota bacterium]
MKIKSFLLAMALLVTAPLLADESPGDVAALRSAMDAMKAEIAALRAEIAAVKAGATGAPATVEDGPAAETPAPPENLTELAGKVESIGEAFTETRNTVDALSKLKVSGYLQAQYVNDQRSRDELTGPATTRNLDMFSVRRARLKFIYQMNPTSRFVLQPDITSSGVVLKDGYVELTEPWTTWKHTLTAGQFNWPYGFEIMYSSSSREVPERSRVVRTLFPSERDRGVMLSGAGFGERFTYRVALVNGTGTAQSFDLNQKKDLVGRIGYSFGALDIGASAYRGQDLIPTATNAKGVNFAKEREGIDFQWATPLPGLGIRGEYLRGRQAPAAGTTRTRSQDVDGWYLYAIQNIGTRHQMVLRVDEYDADTDVGGDAIRTFNPAYIFHWDAHSKVMASYELISSERNDPHDDVFTLRYQFSF